MSTSRLIFLLAGFGLLLPAVAFARSCPRHILGTIIVFAALNRPLMLSTQLRDGGLGVLFVQGVVGAFAAASIVVPFLTRKATLFIVCWRRAGLLGRFIAFALFVMLGIATVNTWVSGAPAAGTAVSVLIWPLALSIGFETLRKSPGGAGVPPLFTLKCALIACSTVVVAGILLGDFGQYDVILGVLTLSFLGIAVGTRLNTVMRLTFIGMAAVSLFSLPRLAPSAQSVSVGVLFGATWMILASMWAQSKIGLGKLVTAVVVASILIAPLAVLVLFLGWRGSGLPARVIDLAVAKTGESQLNLFDRPARWLALLHDIAREPLRLKFTNFMDTQYFAYGHVWAPAHPHNILIAVGRHLGIPGMIIALILIVMLVGTELRVIMRTTGNRQFANVLTSFGITTFLLFRNMWSIKLFVEPVEIVFFSLAVLTILTVSLITNRKVSEL